MKGQIVGKTLPADLLYPVIDQLANTNIQGYGFPHPILETLLSLCLVSTASVHAAQSALYSSVEIDSEPNLVLFLRTIKEKPDLATHVKSLFLLDTQETSSDDTNWDSESVRLEEHVAVVTADILLVVSQNLRRLAIDRPFRGLYPEQEEHLPLEERIRPKYRKALESCTGLEELISVQDELFVGDRFGSVVWPQMAHLKRLSLYNPLIDLDFIRVFHEAQAEYGQALEWFVAVNSDFEESMGKVELDESLGKLKALKGFVICDRGLNQSKNMWGLEGGLVTGIVLGESETQDEIRELVRAGRMPWYDCSPSDE